MVLVVCHCFGYQPVQCANINGDGDGDSLW